MLMRLNKLFPFHNGYIYRTGNIYSRYKNWLNWRVFEHIAVLLRRLLSEKESKCSQQGFRSPAALIHSPLRCWCLRPSLFMYWAAFSSTGLVGLGGPGLPPRNLLKALIMCREMYQKLSALITWSCIQQRYPAICKGFPTIPKSQLGMIIFTILEVDFMYVTIQILKSHSYQSLEPSITWHPHFFFLTELQILKTMH